MEMCLAGIALILFGIQMTISSGFKEIVKAIKEKK